MNEMIEINIEKIMEEIREDIKSKHMNDASVKFNEVTGVAEVGEVFNHNEFKGHLHYLNTGWQIQFFVEVGNGIKGAFKKLIRKMLVFIGVPITEQQTTFNAYVVRSFNEMERYICMQESRQKELEQIIEDLEDKIAELRNNL